MTDTHSPLPDRLAARAWPQRRQIAALAAGSGVLLFLALGAWAAQRSADGSEASPPDAPPPGTVRLTPQQFQSLTIETVALVPFAAVEVTDGRITLDGDRATPVYTPFTGRVSAIHVAPGARVAAGQPLATIDAAEFVQAQNDLRTTLAQRTLARAAAARRQALYEAKAASLQDVQQSQAELAAAETAHATARARLRVLGRSEAEIDRIASGASVGSAAVLAAPIGGVVVDRQVGPGQFVQAGSGTPLFTVADVTHLWLVANVRESDAPHVRVGQRVVVDVPAWPGRTFEARLSYVAAAIDPATHRLPVRARITDPHGDLKPEMLATFSIVTSNERVAVAAPESAVVLDGDGARVWVVERGDLIRARDVTLGRRSGGRAEILAGLRPGERIVTRGSLFVDAAAAAP